MWLFAINGRDWLPELHKLLSTVRRVFAVLTLLLAKYTTTPGKARHV